MKKNNKKGFTIVELVIVIAVIAILAAVLIPTFSSVIKKAKVNNDIQLVRNLNTALATDNKKHETMQDALDAAAEFGYDVDKINNTSASENEILWDSVNDCFVYKKSDGSMEYVPNSKTEEPASYQLWQICNAMPETQTYSIYAGNGWTTATVDNLKVGFDAGKNNSITNVNYIGNGSAQSVVICTNGGELTVNAQYDTIYHYGTVGNLDIIKCAMSSFHEFGNVNGKVSISQGHFKTEVGARISQPIVVKDTTGDVKISAEEIVTIVVESATSNVEITSTKTIYVDDRTEGTNVSKPSNTVNVVKVASEAAFTAKANFEFSGMIDTAANKLDGFYKLTGDVEIAHLLYIPEGVTAVLDLNGFELTSTFEGVSILNNGNLTINDSSIGQTGIIHNICTTNGNGNFGHDAVRNYGTLTINGGTFGDDDLDKGNANTEHRGAALRNLGQCVINGGFFTCGDNYYTWGGSTGYSYAIRSAGDLVINYATVYGAMNGGVAADGGHIEINDGDFSVTGARSFYVLATGSGTITVNGGRFEKTGNANGLLGGFNGMPSWDAQENLAANGYIVNGGTFIKDGDQVVLKK